MKSFIIAIGVLLSQYAFSQPQTNVYYTHVLAIAKNKATCAGMPYTWYNGIGNYIPQPLVHLGTNSWYFTDTNIFTLSFSNALPVIQAVSDFGQVSCGHGTLVVTDASYPSDKWRITLFWPTNMPLPNPTDNVPLTTFGLHTNSP